MPNILNKEEKKKKNRRASHPRVSNGNQINGHVLVGIKMKRKIQHKHEKFRGFFLLNMGYVVEKVELAFT